MNEQLKTEHEKISDDIDALIEEAAKAMYYPDYGPRQQDYLRWMLEKLVLPKNQNNYTDTEMNEWLRQAYYKSHGCDG